jgi:hypothetical protein
MIEGKDDYAERFMDIIEKNFLDKFEFLSR